MKDEETCRKWKKEEKITFETDLTKKKKIKNHSINVNFIFYDKLHEQRRKIEWERSDDIILYIWHKLCNEEISFLLPFFFHSCYPGYNNDQISHDDDYGNVNDEWMTSTWELPS